MLSIIKLGRLRCSSGDRRRERYAEQRVESQHVNSTTSVQFPRRLKICLTLSLSHSPGAGSVIEKVFGDCSRVVARAVTCCGRWGMIKVCRLCTENARRDGAKLLHKKSTTHEQDCAADRCAGLWVNPRLLHMSYPNFQSSRFLTAVLLPKPT